MPKRVLSGVVASNKADKTVIVEVTNTVRHPKYLKVIKTRKRFAAHDENNKCNIGDKVQIEESKPISKTKCWVVVE